MEILLNRSQVEFSENSQTDYKGRQLQTVEIGDSGKNFVKGRFVKIVFRQNHHIKLNEFNQVRDHVNATWYLSSIAAI
jgi:hypothetical protein